MNFLASKQWKRIEIKRRAGIIAPLFYIWSKKSLGIGEILDLKLLIDWCQKVGFTILQLLPLNDMGFNFSPYYAQSSFALDPIYLSLSNLVEIRKENLERDLKILERKFPNQTQKVNYKIKGAKLEKLWQIFLKRVDLNSTRFKNFIKKNNYWLEDYCLYRILKENYQEKPWQEWEKSLKNRELKVLKQIKKTKNREFKFHQWIQWQLYEQLKSVKEYGEKKGIFLKGDIPWLISLDSADVWSHPQYFELNFSAGAPPDAFSKKGQRWGMPSLNWEKIFEDDFLYFKEKLKYGENFYDLCRIDHIVGIFRIWKVPISEPIKNKGKNGFFEPKNENLWKKQGFKILLEMINSTKMLLCAEDLGTIPACCPKVLKELSIPGILVQRWTKNWETSQFKKPEDYKFLSLATLSTPDTSNWLEWWEKESKRKEKENLLEIIFGKKKVRFKKENLILKNLEAINSSSSIFCLLLIYEWLFLDKKLIEKVKHQRLNTPGTISKKNWSIKMPISLEGLLDHPINFQIKKIIQKTKR